MILKLSKRFMELNIYIRVILIFCLFGTFVNIFSMIDDIRTGGVLFRLHFGFFLLYVSQVIFLMMKERMVFVLSLLQVFVAFITNADFTFVPILRLIGYFYYALGPTMTAEHIRVYKYVFLSACVTTELLKTYLMYVSFPLKKKQKDASASEPSNA